MDANDLDMLGKRMPTEDLISRRATMKEFADFVRRSNNSDFAQTPTWNDAVSLVGSMPSAQPDLSEEDWQLIKRLRSYHNGSYAKVIDKLIASAQPMRKRGTWEPAEAKGVPYGIIMKCDKCSFETMVNDALYFNFCPNCGADMREDGKADESD